MLKSRTGIAVAVAALVAGLGVASALADAPPSTGSPAAPPVVQGDDEQGAANDVADAADDVQSEARSGAADDENGDQQGANDQSEEQGDDQGDQQGDDQSGDEQEADDSSNSGQDD
jgi:hypothetical protein